MRRRNPDAWESLAGYAEHGYGSCHDWYPLSGDGEDSALLDGRYDAYYGRKVIWLGRSGEMFRAEKRYIEPIEGNIFYEDKMAAVVDCIYSTPGRVPFVAPVADVVLIQPIDIKESMEYEWETPWTTGDDELDEWLRDEDEFVEEQLGYEEDWDLDVEEVSWQQAAAELRAEMTERLQDAVENDWGDLGSFRVQIRDGNHRTFGALAAGEPYVWVWVIDWTMQRVRDGKYPELAEVLE